jgi:hypothetical protein
MRWGIEKIRAPSSAMKSGPDLDIPLPDDKKTI